mmetsp:Transcript_29872/g.83477  ORF Transcript_29872/g.83477 Transcript_29872/m.83477 type:complete len:293 (+) Transcript_29872:298-1176(+)
MVLYVLSAVVVILLVIFGYLLFEADLVNLPLFWRDRIQSPWNRRRRRVHIEADDGVGDRRAERPSLRGRRRSRPLGSPSARSFRERDKDEELIVQQLDPNAERNMSVTAIIKQRKKKTLVLDLDETLVHSSLAPHEATRMWDYSVKVPMTDTEYTFYVFKRPYVDEFLRHVEQWFEVVIFTASLQGYADPVIDRLDVHGHLRKRYFRESCLDVQGNHVKDLARAGFDVRSTIIVDNSPVAYAHDVDNAIPIDHYFAKNDDADDELLRILPILYGLQIVADVRSVLSLHNIRS